jgi:hypothetical protein
MSTHAVCLILIRLIAGTVNGALGYGFWSITVPLALFKLFQACSLAFPSEALSSATFARKRLVCMSFDAWIVAFGVSTILRDIRIVEGSNAVLFLAAVVLIDAVLLWRFFRDGHPQAVAPVRVRAAGSVN